MASNYNSKSLPTEILVNHDQYSVIRDQEKIENIIKRDKTPNWIKIN